jgi:hypothetical protein
MKIFSAKNLLISGILILAAILIFESCKKENTDITAVVTVKYLNDTSVVVTFADIVIAPQYQDVRVEGVTDATGQFQHVFKYEGILDIVVTKVITGTTDSVRGRGIIRLVPGETVSKTVFVN